MRTISALLCLITLLSCNKDVTEFVSIYFQAEADVDDTPLDQDGSAYVNAPGIAAITPDSVDYISISYIELVPDANTQYKDGVIIWRSPETFETNVAAIDFDSLIRITPNEDIYVSNLKRVLPGTYSHVRVGVACISYNITVNVEDFDVIGDRENVPAAILSFLGYRTYIRDVELADFNESIFDDRVLGFYMMATRFEEQPLANFLRMDQISSSNMNMVNELAATAPIPSTQAIITGAFDIPLIIEEDETRDLVVKLSPILKDVVRFEDLNGNGAWDINAQFQALSEPINDLGLGGVNATFEFK